MRYSVTDVLGVFEKEEGQKMQEIDYAKIGARIREIRKVKGWSQDELAKRCGISLNFLGNIERGTRKMSMDTFVNLCRALETDADMLLWGGVRFAGSEVWEMRGR